MPVDNIVVPSNQHRFIDPYEQRIYQYDTINSDVFLSRVVNSIFRIFGDDIVVHGFDVEDIQFTHTEDDIIFRVSPGMLIQDQTLLEINDYTTTRLDGVSSLDQRGKIVLYTRYQFLNTVEYNPVYMCVNFISRSGNPLYSWDPNRDRTLLGIFEFTKDENDNVISVFKSSLESIQIVDKTYYLLGFDDDRKHIEKYLLHMTHKKTGSSIEWNNGLSFINDETDPGPTKYYGTNAEGNLGWFDLDKNPVSSPLNFTSLADVPDQYAGSEGYLLRVRDDRHGIEFARIEIPDTTKFVKINQDETIFSNKVFYYNVLVRGNLEVLGELRYIDQSDLSIENNEIILNRGETGPGVSAVYSGLRVKRGTLQDALLRYNELNDRWVVGFEGDDHFDTIVTYDYVAEAIQDVLYQVIEPLATKQELNILDSKKNQYIDEGLISQYKDRIYDMKLINGNLIMEEVL